MTLICQIFRNIKPLPKYLTDGWLKISAVFIFEIKGTKKDNIFNFLKGSFSVMRDPMDMFSSVFSETYVRLLTSITSQFFFKIQQKLSQSKYQKVLKTQRPLTKRRAALGPPYHMYLIQLYKCSLEWSWKTLRKTFEKHLKNICSF